MKIAVLGWGSLLWQPKELRLFDEMWYEDGPLLPIEFKRISKDGRLTLVICPGFPEVVSLYAISAFDDLNLAIDNLMSREGTATREIGFFNFHSDNKQIKKENECIIPNLYVWQQQKNIDAIIWTDLSGNFEEKTRLKFTIENISAYLKTLEGEAFITAKQYVENAPAQINTMFRRDIESEFEKIEQR